MTKKPASEASPPSSLDIEKMSEDGQRSLMAVANLHAQLVRNALSVNAELLDFARRRVDAEIQTTEALRRCENMNDAVEVMSGFYQRAFEDYADEANQLMRISADATQRSVETAQGQASPDIRRAAE